MYKALDLFAHTTAIMYWGYVLYRVIKYRSFLNDFDRPLTYKEIKELAKIP